MESKKKKLNRAVFLDKDGTINVYKPYIHKIKDFEFAPRAFQALKQLSKTDYKIIIITNQAGIGKGYYTASHVRILHTWMLAQLGKRHITIDKIYYCPHHPRVKCNCRKPCTGMIQAAAKDFNLDIRKSWLIGDDAKDVALGKRVKARTIRVRNKFLPNGRATPHYYAGNLSEAVKIILSKL